MKTDGIVSVCDFSAVQVTQRLIADSFCRIQTVQTKPRIARVRIEVILSELLGTQTPFSTYQNFHMSGYVGVFMCECMLVVWAKASLRSQALPAKEGENLGTRLDKRCIWRRSATEPVNTVSSLSHSFLYIMGLFPLRWLPWKQSPTNQVAFPGGCYCSQCRQARWCFH